MTDEIRPMPDDFDPEFKFQADTDAMVCEQPVEGGVIRIGYTYQEYRKKRRALREAAKLAVWQAMEMHRLGRSSENPAFRPN